MPKNGASTSFGVSEQQYAIGGIATSCPEVLFAYLFPLTKTLRFAHAITLLPRKMNHALRIASRTAVQDVLSNGRIELGVGRGNTTLALHAFEVDLEKNRDEVNEGIQILKKAFTEDPFMFYGEHYKIPPRSLVPKPLQTPHPPHLSRGDEPGIAQDGRRSRRRRLQLVEFHGLGRARRIGRRLPQGVGRRPRRAASTSTRAQARCSRPIARRPTRSPRPRPAPAISSGCASRSTAIPGSPKWRKSYAYMNKITEVAKKTDDFEYFKEGSGAAIFGSPESCIRVDRALPQTAASTSW